MKNFAFKAIDYEVKRRVRNFKLIGVANAIYLDDKVKNLIQIHYLLK